MCRKLKIYIYKLYIYILLYYYIGILYFFSALGRGLNDIMTNDLMTCVECIVLIIKTLANPLKNAPPTLPAECSETPARKIRENPSEALSGFLYFIGRKEMAMI